MASKQLEDLLFIFWTPEVNIFGAIYSYRVTSTSAQLLCVGLLV